MLYVYILKCSDGSYYTGVTNNPERRLGEHNQGVDCRCYTYSRRPVELVFIEGFAQQLDALAAEKKIKGWSRAKKEALSQGRFQDLPALSRNSSVQQASENLCKA